MIRKKLLGSLTLTCDNLYFCVCLNLLCASSMCVCTFVCFQSICIYVYFSVYMYVNVFYVSICVCSCDWVCFLSMLNVLYPSIYPFILLSLFSVSITLLPYYLSFLYATLQKCCSLSLPSLYPSISLFHYTLLAFILPLFYAKPLSPLPLSLFSHSLVSPQSPLLS